jgi:hypothetical protein
MNFAIREQLLTTAGKYFVAQHGFRSNSSCGFGWSNQSGRMPAHVPPKDALQPFALERFLLNHKCPRNREADYESLVLRSFTFSMSKIFLAPSSCFASNASFFAKSEFKLNMYDTGKIRPKDEQLIKQAGWEVIAYLTAPRRIEQKGVMPPDL